MKRVFAWVLLLVMVLGMFAGCKPAEETPTEPVTTAPQGNSGIQGPGAQDAVDYLKSLYQDDGTETPVDYNRYGIVRVGGIEFNIVWTVDVAEDLVKIVVNEDGTVTVDINEQCEEATPYVLTATITDENGNVASHSWNHILPKAQDMVEIVKAAYALAKGESLPYESRLIGKIISIDAIWTDEYQNITVTIAVEGAEDMPIKCYRMKANDNTIAQIKELLVGNIITVRGTLKNYEGTIEFDAGCILEKVEKGDAQEALTDPGEILKAAYALKKGESLPNPATLTGKVTQIESPYDANYGNISVIIVVEGYEKYPMLCYRLKGTGVDEIAIDDVITVSGIIKNYNGTIEYDAGCMMLERISGGGVAQKPSSDAAKILADAAKLQPGESLPYRATLTGEIVSVDNAYSAQYGNVTVTIVVNGVKFQCYRMVGDGIDQIRETDKITVSGVIKNYNGKLEFDTRCNLDSWEKGPRNVNYGPVKEDVAYRLYIDQTGIDKTVYFNGQFSSNRLQTTTTGSKGADVYAERISGKGLRFYYMDGETKTYIEIEEFTNDQGKQRGGVRITTEPSCYWVYNSECGVYIVNLPTAGKYFLGTYSTYETISASWLGYIDGSYTGNGSAQYVAKFIEASKVQDDAPSTGGNGTLVTDPQAETAYKFGMVQENVGTEVYYITGDKADYYMATTANISAAADVYLEVADGGYYLYTNVGGAKKYINMVVSGTHVNGQFEDAASTVYTYDAEKQTVVATVNDALYWFGTRNDKNYTTIGPVMVEYNGYYAKFYAADGTSSDPTDPEPTVPADSTLTIAEAIAMGSAMSHDTYTSGKYYVTGVIKEVYNTTYGNMRLTDSEGNILTIYGTYSADGSARYDAMSVKPVAGDTVTIYGKVGQYNGTAQIKNGWIVEHTPEGEEPDASEPVETEPQETEPSTGDGYIKVTSADQFTTGQYVMIVKTGYAPSVEEGYWLTAVQPVVSGNTVTDTKGAVWTLTVSGNTVTLEDPNGKLIGPRGGNNNGLNIGEYSWEWSFENGTFVFAGTGADTVYLASNTNTSGSTPGNHRFRGYKTSTVNSYPDTYPYQFTLYKLGGEIVEPEETEPEATEPTVTEPQTTEPEGDGIVDISEALAADIGTTVTVKGVVTAVDSSNIYVQDATGAICVRMATTPTDISLGDTIIGTGARADYNGMPQLGNSTYEKSSGMTLSAKETTIGALTTADICTYVKISNLTVIEVYDNNGGWNYPNITVEDEAGNSIQIYKAIVGKTGNEWDIKVGDVITVSAAVGYHNKFQLRNTLVTEIVVGEGSDPEVTEPEATEPQVTEPQATEPVTGSGYIKVTSADQFTTGQYVMIVNTGYAPGVYENGWLSAVQPVVSGNTVTDTKGAVWTLTVNGSSVTLTDANGISVKPKGGNNNGISEGTYEWAWSFENGVFKFAGAGSDTVKLASNTSTDATYGGFNRFRGYKNTTISGSASSYPCDFTLYKLSETTGEEPEVTEPQVTEPEVTEPVDLEIFPLIFVDVDNGVALTALAENPKNPYGYLPKTNVAIEGDMLTGFVDANIFFFVPVEVTDEDAVGYLFDCYGRVLYMTGTFDSFNISDEIPAEGAEWKLSNNGDGTVYITNVLKNKTVGFDSGFGTFGAYSDSAKHTALLMVPVVDGEEPEETEPEETDVAVTEPEETQPSAGSSVTYTFSNYGPGEQYTTGETYELDATTTMYVSGAHLNNQLRLYDDAKGDGQAIFTCAKAIHSLVINAGYKVASLEVYGSVDGTNWTLVTTVNVSSTSYGDYTVEMPAGTSYKYLKLDAVGAQVRVPYITFTFAD